MVSGEAAERSMESETFRAHSCVLAVPISPDSIMKRGVGDGREFKA